MAANCQYSRSNRENLPLPIEMPLFKKRKIFSDIFVAFLEPTLNFWHFDETISVIAQVFLKLLVPKDVLTSIHKRSCFWKPFGSERVNKSLKLLKFPEKFFYPTSSSFLAILSKKKLVSVRSEILGLLVNTLTANYEYSRSNRENLPLPIQMQLSEKPKTFLESTLNFEHFEKKWAS